VCSGSGVVKKRVTQHVKIPAGINNGENFCIPYHGHAGELGGEHGDLVVTVKVDFVFHCSNYVVSYCN
jgi:molecular chaperone DnaJ